MSGLEKGLRGSEDLESSVSRLQLSPDPCVLPGVRRVFLRFGLTKRNTDVEAFLSSFGGATEMGLQLDRLVFKPARDVGVLYGNGDQPGPDVNVLVEI